MNVSKKCFEDASEPDGEDYFEYYYAGWLYAFHFPNKEILVRLYDESPQEAFLLSVTESDSSQIISISYSDADFQEAIHYLYRVENIRRFNRLLPTGDELIELGLSY